MKKIEKQVILEAIEERATVLGYYRESKQTEDATIADHVLQAYEELALSLGITYDEKEEAANKGYKKGQESAHR